MLRLIEPSAGIVRFEGTDITDMAGQPLRTLRRRMQIVFQDPFASLNPRMTVGDILEEPLVVHEIGDKAQRRARVKELLGLVGLADTTRSATRTSSPAASASASASPARSPSSRPWWCATSLCPRSTCRSRRRWSTC